MDKMAAFRIVVLLAVALLVAGCAGITPYDPPDGRENPPGRGLLSGEDGEFVIYVNRDEEGSVRVESKDEAGSGDKKP